MVCWVVTIKSNLVYDVKYTTLLRPHIRYMEEKVRKKVKIWITIWKNKRHQHSVPISFHFGPTFHDFPLKIFYPSSVKHFHSWTKILPETELTRLLSLIKLKKLTWWESIGLSVKSWYKLFSTQCIDYPVILIRACAYTHHIWFTYREVIYSLKN